MTTTSPAARPARYSEPRPCPRCKGTGQTKFTYAWGVCFRCGGSGILENPFTRVKVAEWAGKYGGSEGYVAISHREPDHRPEAWTVSVYSSNDAVENSHAEFTSLDDARQAANAAYKAGKAAIQAAWSERDRVNAARRVERQAKIAALATAGYCRVCGAPRPTDENIREISTCNC